LLPASSSVDALRWLLEKAPNTEREVNLENMDFRDDYTGKIMVCSWSNLVLIQVFLALIVVINENGEVDAG
jgi:hypothetical protein